MAFASSLFCSSKFLEHTLTKRLTVLACSDDNKDVGYVPLPFSIFGSFYPNVRLLFFWQNIGWRYRRRRKKNSVQQKKNTLLLFFLFCWAQLFAPPSEWRPRRPPIPPVGKTAPVCVCNGGETMGL